LIFLHDDWAWYAASKGDLATSSATVLLVLAHRGDMIEVHANFVTMRSRTPNPRGHWLALQFWLIDMFRCETLQLVIYICR
jgi:hypothetical protein